jgi:hypothetical protein
MDNQITVTAVLAAVNALMPLVVSLVVQQHWSSHVKALIALCFTLLSGVAAIYQGGADPRDVAIALPVAAAAMEASYRLYWKPTGIAPWIEDLTSMIKKPETGV